MLPSQGGWPLLGGNPEPSATGQACLAAPISQVKILRRPKPHENNQQSQSTGRADEKLTIANAVTGKLVELGRKSEQASFPSPTSYYVNDDEWPSIADAESKNLGSQKQKYDVLKKPADIRSALNGQTNQTMHKETIVSSIKSKPNNSYVNHSDSYETNKVPKAPIKTYKERADEYAKARLRILGSAFSEEDNINNDAILNNDKIDK